MVAELGWWVRRQQTSEEFSEGREERRAKWTPRLMVQGEADRMRASEQRAEGKPLSVILKAAEVRVEGSWDTPMFLQALFYACVLCFSRPADPPSFSATQAKSLCL